MKVVLQRVKSASVHVSEELISGISVGILVLAGFEAIGTTGNFRWLSNKIVNLRIFDNEKKIPDLSVKDIGGEILLVSQFTLQASVKKGNRPSYVKAASPDIALPLYNLFVAQLEDHLGRKIQTGRFGADMQVSLVNDGPMTFVIDTNEK